MATISVSLPSDGQTIDASDVNTPFNTIVAVINGNLDDDNIKTGANINGAKLLTNSTSLSVLDAQGRGGWITGVLAQPNTITDNGGRNYSIVFNSTDYTDELSAGMKLKLTRTVTAPTQCADLENGSSQYLSRATGSLTGTLSTITDDITVMAWVKLESYINPQYIASRHDGTNGWFVRIDDSGRVVIAGASAAAVDSGTTTTALPLNRWVHVAATLDMSGTASTIYFDGVAQSVTYVNGGSSSWTAVGNFAIGAIGTGAGYLDGKICQVGIFNAVLSQATINSYKGQTLSGSETNNIGAWTLANSVADSNSNASTLTANGSALTTSVDSPFAGGANATSITAYTAGTTEYAEVFNVTFSTNTTVVVQVPEGYALPTSGGISAVAYSTAYNPLGHPGSINVLGELHLGTDFTTTSTTAVAVTGMTIPIYVPAGKQLEVNFSGDLRNQSTAAGTGLALYAGASSATLTNQFGFVQTGLSSTTDVHFPGVVSGVFKPTAAGTVWITLALYRISASSAVVAGTGSSWATANSLIVKLIQA
jgi:hypothetical protein